MPVLLAYLDPGSGSLFIQAVIAALVAAPFLFRQQVSRLVRAVRGDDRADRVEEKTATTSDEGA